MSRPRVTIIDYEMGNIGSVQNAFQHLGAKTLVTGNPDDVESSGCLILPGVGSFRKAMESLRSSRLDCAICNAVRKGRSKVLGICLGMQLLGTESVEDGRTTGLGLIQASVGKFSDTEVAQLKVPHIGFNSVIKDTGARLFAGLPQVADYYFVHSYRMMPGSLLGRKSICNYGTEFLAGYEENNIYATQFHPEKSQTNGLHLLANFLSL